MLNKFYLGYFCTKGLNCTNKTLWEGSILHDSKEK